MIDKIYNIIANSNWKLNNDSLTSYFFSSNQVSYQFINPLTRSEYENTITPTMKKILAHIQQHDSKAIPKSTNNTILFHIYQIGRRRYLYGKHHCSNVQKFYQFFAAKDYQRFKQTLFLEMQNEQQAMIESIIL